MSSAKTELNESEWRILNIVWTKTPCAAPDVQEALVDQTGWSYSTVRTLMDRMVIKGLLKAVKLRNLTLFTALVTREEAQTSEIRYSLKNAFNGAPAPLVQCLLNSEDISIEELQEIETLLREKRESLKTERRSEPK